MKILHLEDNSSDALLIERTIRRRGINADIVCVRTAEEYRSSVQGGGYDVIVVDNGIPSFNGRAALRFAKSINPDIPVILCSGAARDEEVFASLDEGASDYVVKDQLWQLIAALRRVDNGAPGSSVAHLWRYNAAMVRLVAVVQELSLARDLPSIMEIVRHAARTVTGADGATFVLRDGDFCYYAEEDAISPLWKGQRFPMHTCISGWAMLQGKSTVIEDIYVDSRIPADAYRPTFVKSLAMVPIRTAAPIGAIGAYWATRHICTAEELMLLEALANTTAVAMENVQIYSELERRVQDRTQELESANRELEAFSFAVSHDLRAPLRGISMQLDRLLEGGDSSLGEPSLAAVQSTLAHAQHMGTLIDDLLRLSRISRLQLNREYFDLSAIAAGVMASLLSSDPLRVADVRIEEGVFGEGDRGLVTVALENLLSNAWKYTSNVERPRIEFSARTDADGRRIYSVSDNGAGFDPQYAHRLFQPFQRLHSQEEFPGTGVGLATVYRIISRHGGELSAHSAPGQGASFSFTLGELTGIAAKRALGMPDGPLDG